MSRIGKQPIKLPEGVTVSVNGTHVEVKGSKGTLEITMATTVRAEAKDGSLVLTTENATDRNQRAQWGLFRALIANMVEGVSKGFEKKLEINGVGYKALVQGMKLTLNLGFSHPVDFPLSTGITAKVEKNVITISGIDKQLVGETAATIRRLRPPEPYKGKGIKYADEIIRRKAGKVVKAAGSG